MIRSSSQEASVISVRSRIKSALKTFKNKSIKRNLIKNYADFKSKNIKIQNLAKSSPLTNSNLPASKMTLKCPLQVKNYQSTGLIRRKKCSSSTFTRRNLSKTSNKSSKLATLSSLKNNQKLKITNFQKG